MGAKDAYAFAEHYGPEVEPESLRGLPNYEAIAELLIDGEPTDVQHLRTSPLDLPSDADARADEVRRRSRRNYARAVEDID